MRQLRIGVAMAALAIGVCAGSAFAAELSPATIDRVEVQKRLTDTQSLCERLERPMQAALTIVPEGVARRAAARMQKAEHLLEQAERTMAHRPNLSEHAIERAERELQAVAKTLRITPEPKQGDKR